MLRTFFTLTLSLVVFSTTAHAQDRWVQISEVVIDLASGSKTIDTLQAKGRFKAIRLHAIKGKIILSNVRVTYSDGRIHNEKRAIKLFHGEKTRPIDPGKTERFVDSIDLTFQKVPNDKLSVAVFGLQSPAGALAKRKPELPTLLLASKRVDLDKEGRVAIRTRRIAGRYSKLRVNVRENDVLIMSLSVEYVTGKTETFFIKRTIKAGDKSEWLPLTASYPIAKIYLIYRSERSDGAKARILVFGKPDPRTTATALKQRPKQQRPKQQRPKFKPKISHQKNGKPKQKPGPTSAPTPPSAPPTAPGGEEWMDLEERVDEDTEPSIPTGAGSDDGQPKLLVDEDCVSANKCTSIEIFFGTTRKRLQTTGRPRFGPDIETLPNTVLTLGSAIVTVPKGLHTVGEVERPGFWSFTDWYRYFTGAGDDPEKYFVISENGTTVFGSPEEFISAIQSADPVDYKDHALIFIHGFNTPFDNALYRLAQMTYDLGDKDENAKPVSTFGRPFLFSWPAHGGVLGPLNYQADSTSAKASKKQLKEFLELIVQDSQIENIHVIAHSMGNQPLLDVLKEFALTRQTDIKFNQIILAAPDVDAVVFKNIAEELEAARQEAIDENRQPMADHITVYASSNDRALQFSSNRMHGDPRIGYVPASGPITAKGVDMIDVSTVSTDFFGLGHNEFADDTQLLKDMRQILESGLHPPDARSPSSVHHTRSTTPVQEYWAYPAP